MHKLSFLGISRSPSPISKCLKWALSSYGSNVIAKCIGPISEHNTSELDLEDSERCFEHIDAFMSSVAFMSLLNKLDYIKNNTSLRTKE